MPVARQGITAPAEAMQPCQRVCGVASRLAQEARAGHHAEARGARFGFLRPWPVPQPTAQSAAGGHLVWQPIYPKPRSSDRRQVSTSLRVLSDRLFIEKAP